MKSVWTAVILAILGTAATSSARLNETPEQCDQRYGTNRIEKAGQKFWALERVYVKGGIEVTIRFVSWSYGATKAAYVQYRPLTNDFPEETITGLMKTEPGDWTELALVTARTSRASTPVPKAQAGQPSAARNEQDLIKAQTEQPLVLKRAPDRIKEQNAEIAGELGEIRKVLGHADRRLKVGACWSAQNAYAARAGKALVFFSDEYLKRFDRWKETEATKPPEGF